MIKKPKMLLSMAGIAVIFAGGASASQMCEGFPVPDIQDDIVVKFKRVIKNPTEQQLKLAKEMGIIQLNGQTLQYSLDQKSKRNPLTGEYDWYDWVTEYIIEEKGE